MKSYWCSDEEMNHSWTVGKEEDSIDELIVVSSTDNNGSCFWQILDSDDVNLAEEDVGDDSWYNVDEIIAECEASRV